MAQVFETCVILHSLCLQIGPMKNNCELSNCFDVEDKKDLKINVKVFVSGTTKETLLDALNEGKPNYCFLKPQILVRESHMMSFIFSFPCSLHLA